jgi:hypothetical protein
MSYSYEPNELAPAYRPLYFRNARTTTSAAESVRVEVFCWGVKQAEYRKPYISKSGNNYTFDIDAQSIIQRYLTPKTDNAGANTAVFTSLTNWEVVFPTDSYCSYYIDTYLQVRNADGLLEEPAGTQETSTTKYAISATRPPENIDLEEYYYNAGTPFKLLTDATAAQEIGTNENYSLGVVAQELTAMQLKFYSSGGTLTATVNVDIDVADSNIKLWAVTVGTANLLSFSGSLLAGSDAMPTEFNPGEYYTISFGTGNYTAQTEEIQLNIVRRCADAIRVEWINSFGNADQYTFTGEILQKHSSRGNVREVSLPWNPALTPPMASSKHGLIKTEIDSTLKYEVRETVGPETAKFLRHLASSPEVFIQRDGFRIAAAIENASNTIDAGHQGDVEVKFSIITDREITQDI